MAVRNSGIATLQRLLANVNTIQREELFRTNVKRDQMTLHFAAQETHLAVLEVLLDRDAPIAAQDTDDDYTPPYFHC